MIFKKKKLVIEKILVHVAEDDPDNVRPHHQL